MTKRPISPCTIPLPASMEAVKRLALKEPEHERQHISEYVEWQVNKGADTNHKVVHLERIKTEVVYGDEYEAWDVHTDEPGRWWVITGPTNLYPQSEFPSLDYTLSFHVGVMARVGSRDAKKAPASQRSRLRSTWRRWETAAEAIDFAREAEDFQAVGMRARETLLSLIKALRKTVLLPQGMDAPKAADFLGWFPLIADHFASGPRNERIRGYLKAAARETWQLVNWLTHTSKANLQEAHFALDATSNLLSLTTKAVMQAEGEPPRACPECESYRVTAVYEPDLGLDPPYVSFCESCGWNSAPAPDALGSSGSPMD